MDRSDSPFQRERRLVFAMTAWLHFRRMARLIIRYLVLIGILVPAHGATPFAAPGHDRPNFLLLLSDDQTFRALGALGELDIHTPNLDRLARRGTLFTHAFNQGGWSGAVCVPSRTMLNTGRTLWQCRGTNSGTLPEGAALWGETLGQAGYSTYMVGKWHLADDALKRSFQTLGPLTGGFLPSTPETGAAYSRPAPGNTWSPDDPRWKGHWLETGHGPVHSSEQIADAAIGYLREKSKSTQPFFMYVAFNAPHDPRQAPAEFLKRYPTNRIALPPNFLPRHYFPIDTWDIRDEVLAPYPRTPSVVLTHLQEYYAIISHMDAEIGRILDALDASGKADNTVVIFTSDQGLAVGQHGLMGKQNLYDHSLRVPFILAGPGIAAGQRLDALVYLQGLFATTCDMAGIPIPTSVQFPSLVPLLKHEKSKLYDAIYSAYIDAQRAIQTADWKLIRTPKFQQVQLFDLKADPYEIRNLAGEPAHAARLTELDRELRESMVRYQDPLQMAPLNIPVPAQSLPGASHSTESAARRPNVVFVLSDDHSLQTIGAYGGRLADFCRQQNVTPNLDRLAARGGLFVNGFCGNSLCSPSRASILTGLHSHAHGVTNLDMPLRPGLWTFPETFRAQGYQTAMIGKWHLSDTRPITEYWRILPGQGDYWQPDFIGPDGKESHTGYATDIITGMSLDWLRQRDTNRPFLLMVYHKAPHRNWMPPARYYRWLGDVQIPEPETLFDDYAGRASPAHNQRMEIARDMNLPIDLKVNPAGIWPTEMDRMTTDQKAEWSATFGPRNEAFTKANLAGRELTRWKYQEYMKDYLRCIKAVDDSVGSLMAELKAQGLEENTVVIYSSDQGFYNGEHGWFDKRWIYEESIHMPLIVQWPGVVKPGSRFESMVQNMDYGPTLAEIAGGQAPAGLHGRSFVPILRGDIPSDWRTSIFYRYYDPVHNVAPHFGIRTGRYTMARYFQTGEWELFDRALDPEEMHSIYYEPSAAATVARLKSELHQLRLEFGDAANAPLDEEILPTR